MPGVSKVGASSVRWVSASPLTLLLSVVYLALQSHTYGGR